MKERIGIQLCYPFEERRLFNPKFGWKWPVIVQPKLDGERMRAICNGSTQPILLSSTESKIISMPHIQEELKSLNTYIELDGELYHHGSDFDQIHGIVSRTINMHPDYRKISYYIFDIISDAPQIIRTTHLQDIFHQHTFQYLKLVPYDFCSSMSEIMTKYQEILDLGYEGIIIRHIEANYIRRRSRFILKFKPKKRDVYKIINLIEGLGEHQGMVGKFICQGNDFTVFSIGAGELSHSERRKIWQDREEHIGDWLEVRYQNITSKGVPRFGFAKKILDTSAENDYQGIL